MKKYSYLNLLFIIFLPSFMLLTGCKNKDMSSELEKDFVLAKVYDTELRISDMPGMFTYGNTREDSMLIINNYVRLWVRHQILMHEAEKSIPNSNQISKMVEDYRGSLIRNNYQEKLISLQLDSTITEKELEQFYEKHKQQFQLSAPVVRCYFLKIPTDHNEKEAITKLWHQGSNKSIETLDSIAKTHQLPHNFLDSTWFRINEIANYFPIGTLTDKNINTKKAFIQENLDNTYYFLLLEVVQRQEIPPLSYVQIQARKQILHKRKSSLLDQVLDKMYDDGLNKNEIIIYESPFN